MPDLVTNVCPFFFSFFFFFFFAAANWVHGKLRLLQRYRRRSAAVLGERPEVLFTAHNSWRNGLTAGRRDKHKQAVSSALPPMPSPSSFPSEESS